MEHIKRKLALLSLLFSLIVMLMFFVQPVKADNHDVLDQANVIDAETQRKIEQVNENKLSKIKGHPQIAVVTHDTIDNTDANDIDEYGQQLFDKYKFGTKGYDNGVLIIVLVKDHKMRIQTGYGAESAVPDLFANSVINDDTVKKDFRSSNYSDGIMRMVNLLSNRLVSHKDDLRSKSDVEANANKKPNKDSDNPVIGTILFLVLIAIAVGIGYGLGKLFYPESRRFSDEQEDQFNQLLSQTKLTYKQEMELSYLSNGDKLKILKKVAGGAVFATVLIATLKKAKKRNDRLEQQARDRDRDDWHDHWFGGGGWGSGSSYYDDDDWNSSSDWSSDSDDFFGGDGGFSGGGGSDGDW